MALFKCKMCGGSLEVATGTTVMECEYCGTQQTLPKLEDDRRANLYDRANHFRRNNEFDKAMGIYEQILNDDTTDAEAYWSLVLCRYGIEYVEDPSTHKRIPTVNRAQFTSVFDDDNYKSALQYADSFQRGVYEAEAKAINEIQKEILAISRKEDPFDVFICYKESDNNGRRTPDSVLANDLYHQLTQEGFKVFFARITLEDKLGSAYEPYIFAALNSAEVMVVLGTKPEYFKAVWVKNEWSRYLSLIKQGQKKVLIPAYKDMDPYDLPEEFSHLQAQDMGKLGFMQDLIRGIKKLTQVEESKTTAIKETVVAGGNTSNTSPLLKRVFMFLEDGDWNSANEYCEKVLDIDPECAEAYLGKLMADLHVRRRELLGRVQDDFCVNRNYQKIVRFGNEKLIDELTGYLDSVLERLQKKAYDSVKQMMESATTDVEYESTAELFEQLDYKDSAELGSLCLRKADEYRKDTKLQSAKKQMNIPDDHRKLYSSNISKIRNALEMFESIPGWKDADEYAQQCRDMIAQMEVAMEEEKREKERQAEISRKEAERIAKRNKKIAIIATAVVCAMIAFIVVLNRVIIPNGKYNDAVALMDAGKYTDAIAAFEALDGYKDSASKIDVCYTGILDGIYNKALELIDVGKYQQAIKHIQLMDSYKDNTDEVNEYNTSFYESLYKKALELMDDGKYNEAIAVFEALDGYKDSADKITECKYNDAVVLMEAGNIIEAYEAFVALEDYKDSADKANSVYRKYKDEKLKVAKVGDYVFFGAYEQDNDASNGKEDIEWLVLDVKDGKALLISKYALDCKQYNTSRADVTWETCALRKWLNNDFSNTAFSTAEKALISTVTVSTDKNPEYSTNPGNATQDQVFLLSITEANKYFSSDSARQCKPTDYAVANGAYANANTDNGIWWLRSPGSDQICAAIVSNGGGIAEDGFDAWLDAFAVRPALWIDLNSES